MDGLDAAKVPLLPLPILLVMTGVFLVMLVLLLRRAGSLAGCFLVTAVWLRVMSGAYHFVTFKPLIGSFSINALLSVATVGAGLLIISRRSFSQRWIMPIYALLAVMIISSVINGTASGAIDMFFKWGYVIVLVAAMRDAMEKVGPNRILTLVAYCYAPIFVFQFLSIPLGLGKDTEGANALSYIGGYAHEAAFSIMIVTFVLAVYLNNGLNFALKAGLIFMGIVGILLANYRTAIVSVLPLLVGTFMYEGVARFERKSRGFILVMAMPILLVLVVFAGGSLGERFADLGTLIFDTGRFIKPPSDYLMDDQKVLSGRLFIWAHYIQGYLNGSDLQLLFGYGPNGWVGTFIKYAHNTMVSYLYELGVVGLFALLTVWGTFLAGTFSVRDPFMRHQLLLAQIGFLLFNLATMPHWNIEGNILFSVLQGTMLYYLGRARVRVRSPVLRPGE